MYGDFEQTESSLLWYERTAADPVAGHPTGHVIAVTPPRLRAIDPDVTRRLPRLSVVDLRFPVELVRARAALYTRFARARGLQHSMRLWRAGYQQALLSLAREAAGATEDAPCEAFRWEQHGDEYHVSATFSRTDQRALH